MNADTIFNNVILGYVLVALNNLKISDYLNSKNKASLDEIIDNFLLKKIPTKHLLDTAVYYGILKADESKYSLSEYGKESFKNIGFFTWAIGGFGNFFSSLEEFCRTDKDYNQFVNGKFVAKGSDECYQHLMKEILLENISKIPFLKVADLGCGNAGKLIYFAKQNPLFHGVGIDINKEAILLAKENVINEHLENQISLHCANFLDTLNSNLVFPEIETVTCFMMLHDLFNITNLSFQLFDKLRITFPNVRYFVISDTVLSKKNNTVNQQEWPIFTLGFELAHHFRNQKLFELDYYLKVFKKSNLILEKSVYFGVPNTHLFILKVDD